MGSVLLLACILLATSGCPRVLPADVVEQRDRADARYPWPRSGAAAPAPSSSPGGSVLGERISGEVVIPNDLGRHPAFGKTDTLDVNGLLGEWLLVAHFNEQNIILREPDNFYVFSFGEAGNVVLFPEGEPEARPVSGNWEKTAPGKLLISLNNASPFTYYGEMSGRNFLYLWTFDTGNGLWLVRRPAEAAERIERDEFVFTSGQRLKFTKVLSNSYEGYIEGPTRYEVRGNYNKGVMNMRWIDEQSQSDGYAAFAVTPGWSRLDGVWWLNNYEAAPFGGTWSTATSNSAPATAPSDQTPAPAAGATTDDEGTA